MLLSGRAGRKQAVAGTGWSHGRADGKLAGIMQLDQVKPFFPLVGPLVALVISAVVLPYVRQWLVLYREHHHIIKRQFFENTEVILFGLFENRLEYDALGVFRTVLFGERLFERIVNWNKRPSPDLILPQEPHEAEHLRTVMRMQASSLLLQCVRIGPYFDAGRKLGSAEYRYVQFVACLARPDTSKLTWHDCPRVVLIEESALRKIQDPATQPSTPDKDGATWLDVLRQIAAAHFQGGHPAIDVISSPVGD